MSHCSSVPATSQGLWARRYRDLTNKKLILRRLAFIAESLDQLTGRLSSSSATAIGPGSIGLEESRLVVAITHWRYDDRPRLWDDDEILRTCVRRLVAIPAAAVHVLVLTNDGHGAEQALANVDVRGERRVRAASDDGVAWERTLERDGPNVTVLEPRLRWPRHTGPYLTWAHKRFFRRALRRPSVTHLIYLEDDIGLTEDNLRYWIQARSALSTLGLIPGFLLFEGYQNQRYLIQQEASGQWSTLDSEIAIPDLGRLALARADLPYHASYVMDRALALEHFARSALRSPFRSRIAGWGVHERAAAGPVFGPSLTPLRNVIRLGSAPYLPPARNAVPVRLGDDGTAQVLEGALLEHLRPTYSTNPASGAGKLLVELF